MNVATEPMRRTALFDQVYFLDFPASETINGGAPISHFVRVVGNAAVDLLQGELIDGDGTIANFAPLESFVGSVASLYERWSKEGKWNKVIVIPIYQNIILAMKDRVGNGQGCEVNVCIADSSEITVEMTSETTAGELAAQLCDGITIGVFEATRSSPVDLQCLRAIPVDEPVLALWMKWKRLRLPLDLYLPIRPAHGAAADGTTADSAAGKVTQAGAASKCSGGGAGDSADHFIPTKRHIDVRRHPSATAPQAPTVGAVHGSFLSTVTAYAKALETVRSTRSLVDCARDYAVAGKDVPPLYELDVRPSDLCAAALRLVGPAFAQLVEAWLQPVAPGMTLPQQVHQLVCEVIRVGGRGDALRAVDISEEYLMGAVGCDPRFPVVQLDMSSLLGTAVCGDYDAAIQSAYKSHAVLSLQMLGPLREYLRTLHAKGVAAVGESYLMHAVEIVAKTEMGVIAPFIHSASLAVAVCEEEESLRPQSCIKMNASSAQSALAVKSSPAAALATTPSSAASPAVRKMSAGSASSAGTLPAGTVRIAKKLAAMAEVADAEVRKGLVIEGAGPATTARLMLHFDGHAYREYRWMTPPSASSEELVAYLVLAVLLPGAALRDRLLDADSKNSAAVYAHYTQKVREYAERCARQQACAEAEARSRSPGMTYTTEEPIEGGYISPWGQPSDEDFGKITPQERFELRHGKLGARFPELYPPKASDRPWWSNKVLDNSNEDSNSDSDS